MKRIIKIISIVFCVIIVIPLFVSASSDISNPEIEKKKNEIASFELLLKEQTVISENAKQKISELISKIEESEDNLNSIIARIGALEDEISTTQELLRSYDELIVLKEDEISLEEKKLKSTEDLIINFLRDDYTSSFSGMTTIELIINSKSIGDCLSAIQNAGAILNYHKHLMEEYETSLIRYQSQLDDLKKIRDEKLQYSEILYSKINEYNDVKASIEEYIYQLDASKQEYTEFLSSSMDEEKFLASAIQNAVEERDKLIEEEKERIRLEEERKRKEEEERKRREEEERKRKEAEEAARKAREEAERKAKEEAEREAREARERAEEAGRQARLAAERAASIGKIYTWPLPYDSGYRITGWFGYEPHPLRDGIRFHKALDIGVESETPIYAAADGVVITARYSSSYGNYVVILHSDGYSTLYAHARKLCVKVGNTVKQGDKIAEVGSTGQSTGPHLHFEIIRPNGMTREDPALYFPAIYELHKSDSPRYDSLNNPRRTYYTP